MITDRIEELQTHLNTIIVSEDIDSNEILRLSRELDKLIIQYYQSSPQE
jgi:hypothetical protein